MPCSVVVFEQRGERNEPQMEVDHCTRTVVLPAESPVWWMRGYSAAGLLLLVWMPGQGGWVFETTAFPFSAPRLFLWGVVCLALGATAWTIFAAGSQRTEQTFIRRQNRLSLSQRLTLAAVCLLGLVVTMYVVGDLAGQMHGRLQPLDWLALAATFVAVTAHFWDPAARFSFAGLYFLGLMVVGLLLVQRELSPARFLAWTAVCELTGFLLVAALGGWAMRVLRSVPTVLHRRGWTVRWRRTWFYWSQGLLGAASVLLILWILLDSAFDGMGKGKALLGLSGHWASAPAALMLVGMTILMAWQSRGRRRAQWQYAAIAAGFLFSCSIGWARVDSSGANAWSRRFAFLLVSCLMMTLLTRFGLARVLPASGDWITRACRAAPLFAGAALLLAIVVMIQWVVW